MKTAVWDTYITRKDGRVMHFDIIVPEHITDTATLFNFGKDYLQLKGESGQALSSKACVFCHIETAGAEITAGISEKGYYIAEIENCD